MNAAVQEFSTLGYLVTRFQVSYAKIERVVREENIAPAYVENGIAHYDADAAERIRRHVQGEKAAEGKEN